MNHLSEERINEYLDQTLTLGLLTATQAHLAGCLTCSARVAELGLVFTKIASLSDQALEVDLSPAILLSLKQPERLPRSVWMLAILQGTVVFLFVYFGWPLAQAAWSTAFFSQIPTSAQLLARFAGTFQIWFNLTGSLRLPEFSPLVLNLDISTTSLTLSALGLLLLWLAGNGLFFFPHSRRRS
jgi:hypothetical protein